MHDEHDEQLQRPVLLGSRQLHVNKRGEFTVLQRGPWRVHDAVLCAVPCGDDGPHRPLLARDDLDHDGHDGHQERRRRRLHRGGGLLERGLRRLQGGDNDLRGLGVRRRLLQRRRFEPELHQRRVHLITVLQQREQNLHNVPRGDDDPHRAVPAEADDSDEHDGHDGHPHPAAPDNAEHNSRCVLPFARLQWR